MNQVPVYIMVYGEDLGLDWWKSTSGSALMKAIFQRSLTLFFIVGLDQERVRYGNYRRQGAS